MSHGERATANGGNRSGDERPRLSDRRSHLRRRRRRRRRRRPARGARLREAGLRTACITKVFPTRSHTVAAQGGIAASLGNMGADDWRWHMYDTVKGSDWLGDQDAIEYLCRNAPAAVYELEHWGVPFSRTEDGKIYQRPFGGMTTDYGKGTGAAHLRRRRPHRPRHAAHAVRPVAAPFGGVLHRVFRHRPDHGRRGRCRGVIALNLDDGTHPSLPRPADDPRHRRLWPRLFLLHLGAHLHRRRQRHGAARRPAAAGHGVRAVPPDRHLWRRLPDHRRRARRRRLSAPIPRASASWSATRRPPRISPRATWSRASMTIEIREGRGVGTDKDHIYPASRSSRSRRCCTSACRASPRSRASSPASICTREPIPVLPTVHYNMGGIPTNYHGEVLTKKDGDPDAVVPGLMAIGEAACVSVHGANRLGSNSLIDLVVFGRAAALRCAEIIDPSDKPARPADGLGRHAARPPRPLPLRHRRHADRRAAPQDAEGDADQLRRVPHRRGAGGRPQAASTRSRTASPTSASPTAR